MLLEEDSRFQIQPRLCLASRRRLLREALSSLCLISGRNERLNGLGPGWRYLRLDPQAQEENQADPPHFGSAPRDCYHSNRSG